MTQKYKKGETIILQKILSMLTQNYLQNKQKKLKTKKKTTKL